MIEGANIHVFVFTDRKNNRFQKKLVRQNADIWIFATPIIVLAAPVKRYRRFYFRYYFSVVVKSI